MNVYGVSSSSVLLYPIVDVDACESKRVQPAKLASWLYRAGVELLQLRAKSWDKDRLSRLVLEVQSQVPQDVCRVVINDHVEVAQRCGSWGVHVGQTDLPVPMVRTAAPGVAVGISTHSLEQVNNALRTQPDYVAFGPVFGTLSKQNPDPEVGVDGLQAAYVLCERAGIPLVAIGGITPTSVDLVTPWCNYVAVIGAITHADEASVHAAVQAFGVASRVGS